MLKRVVPAIIAKSPEELEDKVEKVKHEKTLHLDVMDGKFVDNSSLNFNFNLLRRKKYEAHLMIQDPESWIKKHAGKVETIIFHFEAVKNPESVITLIRKKHKKAGIAINPETKIIRIKKYIKKVDQVLIMTVHPGFYGSRFLPQSLEKVRQLRRENQKLNIGVDGSINNNTITNASRAGANLFVSGSYVMKARNSEKALRVLRNAIV